MPIFQVEKITIYINSLEIILFVRKLREGL